MILQSKGWTLFLISIPPQKKARWSKDQWNEFIIYQAEKSLGNSTLLSQLKVASVRSIYGLLLLTQLSTIFPWKDEFPLFNVSSWADCNLKMFFNPKVTRKFFTITIIPTTEMSQPIHKCAKKKKLRLFCECGVLLKIWSDLIITVEHLLDPPLLIPMSSLATDTPFRFHHINIRQLS
jgi:hypothetical protein